uniref:28S ribosomal protein S30, mitochondrial n=1 Tax=Strongyloides papillosus TaxID=174720 RepID=A0A0N5CEU9_STREA
MYLKHCSGLLTISSIPRINFRFFCAPAKDGSNKLESKGKSLTYEELDYVKPPNYASTYPMYEPSHMLQEEFMPEPNKTGYGPRLADYLAIKKIVKSLGTPQERIEFVNPYEREWTRVEKKWHRKWHPRLFSTRKAWALPTIPKYFDCLSYYQYITKMRLVDDKEIFDGFFKDLILPTESFEKKVTESLICYLFTESSDTYKIKTDKFLKALFYDAQSCLSPKRQSLKDLRISQTGRIESFWIRGGFTHLYEWQPIWAKEPIFDRRRAPKFIGDDRRKLGELAFTMRDEFVIHLRQKQPMKELFSLNETELVEVPLFEKDVDIKDICYSPKVFNLWPDADPLWQCPGYEYDCGETHKYGRVALKNTFEICDHLNYWNPANDDESVKNDMYKSVGISSLFNWLNAQAHCDGYTQYTDLERPYVSNLILGDGNEFAFVTGQLNTLAINIDNPDFINNKTNACYIDGPYMLYDKYDEEKRLFYHLDEKGNLQKGLNKFVLLRILQLIAKD